MMVLNAWIPYTFTSNILNVSYDFQYPLNISRIGHYSHHFPPSVKHWDMVFTIELWDQEVILAPSIHPYYQRINVVDMDPSLEPSRFDWLSSSSLNSD